MYRDTHTYIYINVGTPIYSDTFIQEAYAIPPTPKEKCDYARGGDRCGCSTAASSNISDSNINSSSSRQTECWPFGE